MSREAGSLLSVRDLVVQYPPSGKSRIPLTAVRGVNLDIEPAGIFGLVGESGSGKSSLAHAILQLAPTLSGKIRFRGQDLTEMTPSQARSTKKNIQLVFQDSLASLSPRRSILQALLEPLAHFRIGPPDKRREKALAALESVGLEPQLQHRYPLELSGGQRQRVALARALVAEPELIIADEPVSSLDVTVQARIIELIGELRRKHEIAFLFVSHDLDVVRRLADTVAVMYLGKIVESASAEVLFSSPAHPYTRSLIAAVPKPDPNQPGPSVLEGEPPSPLTPPTGCVFHSRCPDKMEPCATIRPREHKLGTKQELQTAGHRVRCHLWKPKNSTK